MINIQVNRREDGILVSGEMGAESSDALLEELACLCADAIDMMERDYAGEDDIGEPLERALAEAIARRRTWNAEEREKQGKQEEQNHALH